MRGRDQLFSVVVKLLGGVVAVLAWAIWVRLDRSPADEQAARALVERSYRAAQSGGEDDTSLGQVWQEMLQREHGRVLRYRLTGTRLSWRPHIYAFTVDVQREQGQGEETAEVMAGWSKRGHVLAMDKIQHSQ